MNWTRARMAAAGEAAAVATGPGQAPVPGAGARVPGGGFVVQATDPGDVFTPERVDETQRAIRDAVAEFVEREVAPRHEAIEARDYAAHRALLRELGAQGYLGVDVPETYGGAGLDKVTSLLVSEGLAGAGSFAVTYGAHVGIGTLPLVFFGTESQRARWLPGLADGSVVAAYALTEPGAGSDAQGIRARADLTSDGSHYVLNGSKQFITNAGFADLFTIYAKVDGERFTAFLVPRDTPGLVVEAEEHKLGVRGSSTCAVTLTDARVPVENVLGEVGRGHIVAFNVLNVGRFKLAAGCLGGMRPSDRSRHRLRGGPAHVRPPAAGHAAHGRAHRHHGRAHLRGRVGHVPQCRAHRRAPGRARTAIRTASAARSRSTRSSAPSRRCWPRTGWSPSWTTSCS